MNAQAILEKIGQDAGDAALRIADDAQAKIAQMRAASGAKIEAQHAALLSRAQRESDELEQRMLRMAELDSRKALLAKKRALIDEAFTRAGVKLAESNAAEKRAFFLRMVTRNAAGTETLLVSENAPWFDDAFLNDANAALSDAGKPACLTLADERTNGGEGITLRIGGAETRMTLDVLLEESRAAMEQQVASVLFD
jgi:vacuolar-type H+-ATPase subunit E/Vma4